MIGLTLGFLIPYVAIFGILLILERQFIKKRKKWEWVIPVIVTALVLGISIQAGKVSSSSFGPDNISISSIDPGPAEIQVAVDENGRLIGIGKLIIGNTAADIKYIDLEFREGELVGTPEALIYKKEIEKDMEFEKSFSGKSITYEELEVIWAELRAPKVTYSLKTSLEYLALLSIALVISWGMLLVSRWKRKRRNQLKRTKLDDI